MKTKIISILALLLTVTQGAWADVTISSVSDWNTFAANVSNGTDYSGQAVKLTADIATVTTIAGTSGKPFRGTFDGQGHTLTVSYSSDGSDYIAPFYQLDGTVQNLVVAGNIGGSGSRHTGIAAFHYGTIRNCRVSADISGSNACAGFCVDGGGLIEGCVYDGTINVGTSTGGFVGWAVTSGTRTIRNSVFSPKTGSSVSNTFYFSTNEGEGYTCTLDNCYYTQALGTVQGKQARSISAGTDVTSLAISGAATATYSVSGITVYAKGIKYNGVYYASNGENVSLTLSHANKAGYTFNLYSVSPGSLTAQTETSATLAMTDADQTIKAAYILPTDGTGAYLIGSVADWESFCTNVNTGTDYSGQTVKLTANVSGVTTMAGTGNTSSDGEFNGTFDGQGHTLTVSYSRGSNDIFAPFRNLTNGTVQNLVVDGSINGTGINYAGIAVYVKTGGTIRNCRVSADISGGNFSGGICVDGGGLIEGCVFDGTINIGTNAGGFVGWAVDSGTRTIRNSVFSPKTGSSVCNTFYYSAYEGEGYTCTLTNCYYTQALGTAQGKQARSISAGTDVTSLAISGASTEYNVSGITAYATGIKYNDVYYAGNGESVSLALSHADAAAGYSFNGYTATAGTLSGTTLTMPDADVTINATWTPENYTISYDLDGGSVASENPTSYNIESANITLNNPTKDGYTFAGWTGTDLGAATTSVTITTGSTGDRSYTATWTHRTTSGIDWNPSANSGTFLMPGYNVEVSTELWYKVDEEKTLDENIAAYGTKSDFFLNRTLTANVWNTFASPFAIAAGDMEKYFGAGAKVRQLNTTSVDGTILTLNFTDASAIVAGQPYLVKPAANVDFSADGKEFAGVSLTAALATPTPTTYVNFIPTLGKTAVDGNVKDILILNTSGTLVHPSAVGNMKGFRAYFVMHDAPAGAREFIMNFGDGETTGIQSIRMENGTTPAEGTYDLSGRRIQGQPTQKGVYIQNGKKVVIK